MNLDYALVTDSSLPDEVKESANYVSLDKDQWLDLVEYSEVIASDDPDQKILLLICAKGTEEQEEAERLRKEELAREEAELYGRIRELEREVEDYAGETQDRETRRKELLEELEALSDENAALSDEAAEKERRARERAEEAEDRKNRLRHKSETIFNGLYNK